MKEAVKNIQDLLDYIAEKAALDLVFDDLIFIETRVFHNGEQSTFVIFGARKGPQMQQVAYHLEGDFIEYTLHIRRF